MMMICERWSAGERFLVISAHFCFPSLPLSFGSYLNIGISKRTLSLQMICALVFINVWSYCDLAILLAHCPSLVMNQILRLTVARLNNPVWVRSYESNGVRIELRCMPGSTLLTTCRPLISASLFIFIIILPFRLWLGLVFVICSTKSSDRTFRSHTRCRRADLVA